MPMPSVPRFTRRTALAAAIAAPAALAVNAGAVRAAEPDVSTLHDMTADAKPIAQAEYEARIEHARRLMRAQGIKALLIEPGASMIYFTGLHWGRSERLTAAIIPLSGAPAIVTPFFEAPRVRQTLAIPADIRVWEEDENPLAQVAAVLKDRGAAAGPIGIEETVRYFAVDGLEKALPKAKIVSGAAVVRGCRMHKSPAEIALMQRATDVTIAAYRFTIPRVREGMTPGDVSKMMDAATIALGGSPEFSLVLMGKAAAYPHGSREPQVARPHEVILMDCGCTVQGYQSDVSRTFVLGAPTKRERQVWDQVHRGQQIAFAAARLGAPAGSVDDAVRRYYESLGYGPGYKLPGLSHRTGHGIGLDGHEPVNLVHGEKTPLEVGMCFSDEPGLYIPGEFGIRLEDCFHMTEAGPKWFSEPSESIEKPV